MQTLTNTMAPNPAMQTMQPMPMMYNPQMMMYPHPQMVRDTEKREEGTGSERRQRKREETIREKERK